MWFAVLADLAVKSTSWQSTFGSGAWFAMADLAVKSTAVLGAAWIAALALRRRSAAARHLVWTAAAAAILALPLLSLWLPALPVRGAAAILPSAGVVFHATATARAGAPAVQSPASKPAIADRGSAVWRPDWALWLSLLWTAGAAVLAIQMLTAYLAVARLRRRSAPWPDRALRLEHRVDVRETPAGSMPMTYGILRPVVFLPADAVLWSGELRRAVLLHELAHVRRGDIATQMLARLALTMHWWNPLAWIAWREFLNERERAADDLVLAAGARASDYAGHLLAIARSRQAAPTLAWAAVCAARRSQLEGRLAAILDARTSRGVAGWKAALAAMAAAAAVAAPVAAIRAPQAGPRAIAPVAGTAMQAIAPEPAQAAVETPAPAVRADASQTRGVAYGIGLLKIADLERHRNRNGEAEAFYTKAASVLGDRAEAAPAWLYLGIRKRNPGEAIECLRTAERLDPATAGKARMWMALARERQQRYADAEALYKSAVALAKPGSADAESALHVYARFLRQQGRADESLAIEKQAAVQTQPVGASPGVYRVGNGVQPPALLHKTEPEYSEEARAAKYQGTVVIYVEIGTDGRAHNIRVRRGLGLGLDEKAIEAIHHWRFQPGSKDGMAVPVAATIEVNFRLL